MKLNMGPVGRATIGQTVKKAFGSAEVRGMGQVGPKPVLSPKMGQQRAMNAAINKAGASKLGIGGIAAKYR